MTPATSAISQMSWLSKQQAQIKKWKSDNPFELGIRREWIPNYVQDWPLTLYNEILISTIKLFEWVSQTFISSYLPQIIIEIPNLELRRINLKRTRILVLVKHQEGYSPPPLCEIRSSPPLCKVRSTQPTALKFDRLTADVMNYKIC